MILELHRRIWKLIFCLECDFKKEPWALYFGFQKTSEQRSLILANLKCGRILNIKKIRTTIKEVCIFLDECVWKEFGYLLIFFLRKILKGRLVSVIFSGFPNIPAAVITNLLSLDFTKISCIWPAQNLSKIVNYFTFLETDTKQDKHGTINT